MAYIHEGVDGPLMTGPTKLFSITFITVHSVLCVIYADINAAAHAVTKTPKLTTYLQFSSLFIGSKLIRGFNTKSFLSHTKHFILVIHLIFGHSYISSTLGQLVHLLSSHLVALLISLVSKSLVDLLPYRSFSMELNYIQLIFVRFITIIL